MMGYEKTMKIVMYMLCCLLAQGHSYVVKKISWSRDDSYLYSYHTDKTIRRWNMDGTVSTITYIDDNTHQNIIKPTIKSISKSPTRNKLAIEYFDGYIDIQDNDTSKHYKLYGHFISNSVGWSGDGKRFVYGSWDKNIKIWDIHKTITLDKHAYTVSWSPDMKYLASVGLSDESISIWDLTMNKCIMTLTGHTDWINVLSWNMNSTYLASSSYDKTIRIWNVFSGICISTFHI